MIMKYKDNKEHHIDNLFARKLGNLEGTPSENAWQTLEKGLSQKARKKNKAAFWLPYAAAAAIALMVVSVWLLLQQMPGDIHNSGLADKGKIESKQNHNLPATSPDKPQSQDITGLPDNSRNEGQIAMQEEVKKGAAEERNVQPEKTTLKEINREKAERKPATKPVLDEVKRERITKPAITPLENTVAQIDKQPAPVTPAALAKEESTTIVVTVKLDEEMPDISEEAIEEVEESGQVQKQTKAGKFFSTLKKIKKGDFDELGIKPETIVAYVKDRTASNNQSNEK
jgi:hypothetical protein